MTAAGLPNTFVPGRNLLFFTYAAALAYRLPLTAFVWPQRRFDGMQFGVGILVISSDVEELASEVEDNGGVYIVPAFSGLFAPYWKSDARGVIVGLTRYVNRSHIARAVLEATAWQTREVVDAMNQDSGVALTALKVDGGMVANEILMQFQSDVLGVPVIRPTVAETTCLGAAYAAGLAVGFWEKVDDLRANWGKDKEWTPQMDPEKVAKEYAMWKKAVTRTFGWIED